MATQNPLSILGYYNCPGATNVGTTNVGGTAACSVVCDAITILSPSWSDASSFTTAGHSVSASSDTVNTAMIAGNVLTTDTTASGFSGGVHNLTRLLESWTGDTLTLNTSIICLYTSVQASQQFQMPGTYYEPPTRQFSFDLNYTYSTGLPPGTPLH